MPKSYAQRGKEFRERKKKRKTSSKCSRKNDKKNQKNSTNSSSATAKSRSKNSSTSSCFGFGIRKTHFATNTFKHVGKNANITRQQIETEEYINGCIENNLAFPTSSSVTAVITFIYKVLVLHTHTHQRLLQSLDPMMIKKPIILTGYFNVTFASEEANSLIEFLKWTLNLTINTYARKEKQDTEQRLMQFSHVFLIDYNRGFSYLHLPQAYCLFLGKL
ncbi:hypothetical protein TNCV_2327921 [Trichonephila clavipes]|nr:hypothetical protein TNCV_2327921 [Trichonephila clavipes]